MRSRLITAIAVVLCALCLAAIACGAQPTQDELVQSTPLPSPSDTWLSSALRSVPQDYGDTYLQFVNLRAARMAADATDFKGLETLHERGISAWPWTYDSVYAEIPGRDYVNRIYDATGIDLLGLDYALWAGEIWAFASGLHLTIIKGGFGDDVSARLERLGYQSDTYDGITWFYAWSEYSFTGRAISEHPFGIAAVRLNAIARVDDKLLIRKFPRNMERQIDVHRGRLPSLWDNKPYKELAQAVGDELLAGAFATPANIRARWAEQNYSQTVGIAGYAPEAGDWGTLDAYSVAVVGYRVHNGQEETMIALHYADPDAAARNAAELELRWNTAQLHIYMNPGFDREETLHYPSLAAFCAPFETRALKYADFSILTATCPASDFNDYGSGMSGRSLWLSLLRNHTLHFLIPDIEAAM